MTANFSTQIHRALFALPLLAVGLLTAFGAPAPAKIASAPATSTSAERAELRDATLALAAGLDCDATARPTGALGLARMPGDIGVLNRRMRCAQ
jgi:hypothetical protein